MILSRQSILKYMQRERDPLEIYVIKGRVKECINPNSIYSHSIDLHLGEKIVEVDMNKLLDLLIQKRGIDKGLDTILEGGLNPIAHKDLFNEARRVLDLSRIKSYEREEIAPGIFRVEKDGYNFQTKVVEEDGKIGIVLHPEIYFYNQGLVHNLELLLNTLDLVNSYLKEGNKEKALLELQFLRHKIVERKRAPTPSSSFILAQTQEVVKLPRDLVGEIHTKSKLARKGLSVHPSSGKVDSGFHNYLVLEIKNQGILPLTLFQGDPLAEIQFIKLDRPTELPYKERKNSSFKSLDFLV